MKTIIQLIFIVLCVNFSNAQNKSGSRWVIGGSFALEATFTDTSRPAIQVKYDTSKIAYPYYYTAGHSNICDSATGKLLFSTTGMLIHDTTGAIMDNGDHLVESEVYNYNFYPTSAGTQGSIILPKGNNGQYYVFIPTISDSAWDFYMTNNGANGAVPYDRFLYNVVDMNSNGGLGKVIVKNKMLMQGVAIHKTMMQACRHSNGVDWWLLKQGEYDTNRIYRFLVKADTIEGPWVQNFAEPKYPEMDLSGQFAFSKDGKKFASIQGKVNKLFMADFDRCTGELNNPQVFNIPIDSTTYPQLDTIGHLDSINGGVCFSQIGNFLYISKRANIYQFEYQEPDSMLAWYRVQHGADTTLQKFQYYAHLGTGIDGRIYIANWGGQHLQMSVVDKPDIKGVGCQFCRKCFRLDTNIAIGMTAPPNMPDYNLGASGQVCWPVSTSQLADEPISQLEVYPNPASTIFYVKNAESKKKELYNVLGELLFSTKADEINVRHFAKGIYYLRSENEMKKVIIE